ncbi:MAG: hypothetical protein IPM79_21720 [Polyangiaceae bacterium]|nr:hypothetical protein [Polyangiaceae bacterium]
MQLVQRNRFSLAAKSALLGVTLAAVALTQACGDDTGVTPEDGLAFEQFAETYRQAQCERAVKCGFMPDVDTCYVALGQDFAIAEAISAAAFGDLTYDPQAAATCIETVTSASCEGFTLLTPQVLEACDTVFGNRRGEGEPCVAAAQCQGIGSICEGACGDGCCPGVCRGVSDAGQMGDICSDLAPCSEGLRCLFADVSQMFECIPLAGANEPCVDYGCIPGYACDSSGSGRCFAQASTGSACNPALADACADLNEYCSADQQRCVPLPRPGEPCGVNPVATSFCARMAYCADTTCQALPSVGEECAGESACLGQLSCSGDPEFICGSLSSPSICVNFE